jgi:uncharacterized protein
VILEKAVYDGDLSAAEGALRSGADVNSRDSRGFSPLMIAAGRGQREMVELLLNAGADPHMIETHMGATALHKAAQCGCLHVIELLLDHGAFVDQQSATLGNTPLIDAVLHRQENAVLLMLARGARTTIRNHWQQSALELAREDGSKNIVEAIEAHDTAVAQEAAAMILIAAVKAGDRETAESLIETGADLDQRLPVSGQVDDDYTALGVAVREGRINLVRLLLEAGADLNRAIGLMRGTVLHEASFSGHTEILHMLLDRHAMIGDLREVLAAKGPYNGFTALHDAAWHGHLGAAKALTDAGAPLCSRTHSGLTPRELALLYGYDELAAMLARAER